METHPRSFWRLSYVCEKHVHITKQLNSPYACIFMLKSVYFFTNY